MDTQTYFGDTGGQHNLAYFCTRYQVEQGRGDRVAVRWIYPDLTRQEITFQEFEKKPPDFKYYPILSQPTEACDWDGRCGYVMPFFDEFIKDPANTEAYLCGSPGMIAAVEKSLKEKGISEDKIYFDSFA